MQTCDPGWELRLETSLCGSGPSCWSTWLLSRSSRVYGRKEDGKGLTVLSLAGRDGGPLLDWVLLLSQLIKPHSPCWHLSAGSVLRHVVGPLKGSVGFPGGISSKEPACQCRRLQRHGFDPLEEGMATYPSIFGWRISWTEEPGGLQSTGSQRVGHDWSGLAHACGLGKMVESEVKVKVAQSCPTLAPHRLYGPWNSPGQNTGVGGLSLLQGIFPTQGLNPGLLHCRWILYQLSHKGSPKMKEATVFSRILAWPKGHSRNIFLLHGGGSAEGTLITISSRSTISTPPSPSNSFSHSGVRPALGWTNSVLVRVHPEDGPTGKRMLICMSSERDTPPSERRWFLRNWLMSLWGWEV